MKRFFMALALVAAVVACGSQPKKSASAPQVVQPVEYSYVIKNVYPHSPKSYTQGLQFVDGIMWEGTGEYGRSEINTYALGNEKPQTRITLPRSEFGEGITLLGDKLYQLTWESHVCHVYDVATGKKLRDFRYAGEGWGLTSDGEKLFMSNGSANIYKLNPETFSREATITVTLRGEPVRFINELEWIDGKIWANVYTTDHIVIINPENGVVEGVVNLSNILPESEFDRRTDVLNGIAYDSATKRIFVTGKNWSKLFEIKLVEQ